MRKSRHTWPAPLARLLVALWAVLVALVVPTGVAVDVPMPAWALPPPTESGQWRLIFEDRFRGNALDAGKWSTCYPWWQPEGGCTNAGNPELQWFLPEQVSVKDDALVLLAERRAFTGSDGGHYDYVSGMITSGGAPGRAAGFAFQYGYVETRMQLPAGQGLWPAFWLLPAGGGWPPEIDVAEHLAYPDPHEIDMAVHFGLPGGGHDSDVTQFSGPDFSAGWHVFGLAWAPDRLTWYVDGIARKTYTQAQHIPHEPMYLLFSLAVNGDRPPDAGVRFPAALRVGYVRVWQR